MLKKIFNADDFGISRGVNAAIEKAYRDGILNSASLMVNQKYADEAVAMACKMPHLATGLHLNLTNEKSAADPKMIPLLVDDNGKLKNGFVKLLILSFLHPHKFTRQVMIEVRAQVRKYLQTELPFCHIDGHRHVQMIPAVFKVVRKIQKEYGVPRVRVMNENLWNTIKQNRQTSYLFDGGLVKYIILRFLCWWNGYRSDVYFYTTLFTCKISAEQFRNIRIPKGYEAIEVMIHPGMPEIDSLTPEDVWDTNILSPYRTLELETLLNKDVPNNIKVVGEDD
ncbi:MAG: ChbG/HpnK family deacetylase [Alphaproteobacteria bacterium]|nr:ChbG/HpnK family deacetylase [Alphaproteobacteria bacterium]